MQNSFISKTTVRADVDSDDGTYIMNGTKTWVVNAPSADVFTVFANLITRGNTLKSKDTTLALRSVNSNILKEEPKRKVSA